MTATRWLAFVFLSALLAGCGQGNERVKAPTEVPKKETPAAEDQAAEIKASLAKLSEADREAAESQVFCAVHNDSRLGSMGVPVKISVKNKAGDKVDAFLCCKACEKAALKDEAKTAAVVEELNIQSALAKLSPEDRKLAEAQRYCAVDTDGRLGWMGAPKKYIIKDKDGVQHPVFVCCEGCIATIKEDEAKTLQIVADLKKKNSPPAPK